MVHMGMSRNHIVVMQKSMETSIRAQRGLVTEAPTRQGESNEQENGQ